MAPYHSQAYLSTQIKTSDRMEIIIALYEAILSNIAQAMEAAESGDVLKRGEKITGASEILLTLCESLDFSQPGSLSSNLFTMYSMYLQQLLEANRTNNLVLLQSVHSGVSILLDAWRQIADSPEANEIRLADAAQKRKAPTMEMSLSCSASLALTA